MPFRSDTLRRWVTSASATVLSALLLSDAWTLTTCHRNVIKYFIALWIAYFVLRFHHIFFFSFISFSFLLPPLSSHLSSDNWLKQLKCNSHCGYHSRVTLNSIGSHRVPSTDTTQTNPSIRINSKSNKIFAQGNSWSHGVDVEHGATYRHEIDVGNFQNFHSTLWQWHFKVASFEFPI